MQHLFFDSQTLLQSIEKVTKDRYTIIYNLFSISLKGLKGYFMFLFCVVSFMRGIKCINSGLLLGFKLLLFVIG